jgi:hypothetical protein
MIYNMERVDRTIDKLIRDLGLGQSEIPFADFIEWIADGLQHIGAYYQYKEKECSLIVEDYQAILPCDLYKVIRMIRGFEINCTASTGYFGGSLTNELINAGLDLSLMDPLNRHYLETTGISNYSYYDNVISTLSNNKNLIGNPVSNKITGNDINVNMNIVTTSFRSGIIMLQYLALPIDERGFPLIPDDVSFRDALFWKCTYQLSMRDPASLPSQRLQDSEYCRSMWDKYCGQARASANAPDLAMVERMANNWTRLVSHTSEYNNNNYRTVGKHNPLNFDKR